MLGFTVKLIGNTRLKLNSFTLQSENSKSNLSSAYNLCSSKTGNNGATDSKLPQIEILYCLRESFVCSGLGLFLAFDDFNNFYKGSKIMTTSESKMMTEIMQELQWCPNVTEKDISVVVKNGIVTLNGKVPAFYMKAAAEKAVMRVSGVKACVEELKVKLTDLTKRDDKAIARAAQHALSWNSCVPKGIKCVVENGWLMMTGEVEWAYQREAAMTAVCCLCGLTGLSNAISIKPKIKSSDVKSKIEMALRRITKMESDQIKVIADGSDIVLTGCVNTHSERWDAVSAAWAAPGVTSVKSNLQVMR